MARRETESTQPVSAPQGRPPWLRYAVAVLLVTVVSIGAHKLDPDWDLRGRHPYLIEWPVVIAAAWYGGLGPGLVAVALSGAAIDLLWIRPEGSLAIVRSTDLVAVALYAMCGLVVTVLIEQLHRSRRREHDLRTAREGLLGVVAHDLRSPLNSIGWATRAVRLKPSDLRPLDFADRAARRMEHLIQDLLDASRLDADEALPMSLACEPIAAIVEEAVAFARVNGAAKSIVFSAEPLPGVQVQCDRARLLQALGNLLDNAVKFSPEGGRVAVTTTSLGALVRIEVRDSGPGIKPEQQAMVFRRHWTEDKARTGAGLGLFIAQGIVRAHGGRLWLHSEPGHGTSFFLTLPATVDPTATPGPRSRAVSERFRLS